MRRFGGRLLAAFERQPLYVRLCLLALTALAVRLIYSFVLVGPTVGADTPLFFQHTQNLLDGRDYGVPNRPPAFPYLMALLIRLFGNFPASVVAYQTVLSAAIPPLMCLLGRNVFGERSGTLAGWYSVIHYPLVDFARLIGSDTQFAFAVVLTAWLLSGKPSWLRSIAGGLSLGFTALTRGTALAFFPFLLALGVTRLGPPAEGRAQRAHLAAILSAAVLAITPWLIRNALRYDAFVPISSEGSLNFFLGATPEYLLYREERLDLARQLTDRNTGNHHDFIQPQYQAPLMKYWLNLWFTRPGLHLVLRVISFLDFWSPVERVRFYALVPGNIYWAVTYGLLLPFFAFGVYLILKRRLPGTYFLLAAIAGTTALHTLSHAEQSRYRGASVESLIALIALYGLIEYWRRRFASSPDPAYNGIVQESAS